MIYISSLATSLKKFNPDYRSSVTLQVLKSAVAAAPNMLLEPIWRLTMPHWYGRR
jgi:hypothetical protein